MFNKVFIIGRLGGDPDLRYTQSGAPVATMNVAANDSYTDRDGNRQDRTEWFRVVVFQRQAENCANYLTKGSLVFVEGSLQTRKYQDQQGVERTITEVRGQRVVFLDRKGERQNDGDEGYGQPRSNRAPKASGYGGQDGRDWNDAPKQPRQSGHVMPQSENEDNGPIFPSEINNEEMPF